MGSLCGGMFEKKKEVRLLMVGLDAAGKTTILYQLKLGQTVNTQPTSGFNVESLEYKNFSFTIWDCAGGGCSPAMWRHYYQNTHGVIFVVDSTDDRRIDGMTVEWSARKALHFLFEEEELKDCVLLVLANKQDRASAMTLSQIADRLGLSDLKDRKWHLRGSSATTGEGLYEGLDWICGQMEGAILTEEDIL